MPRALQRDGHLYGLDLLRILAASMVLLNHFGAYGWQRANGFAVGSDAAFPFLSFMVGTGAVGVEIFFVISGFVIAMSATGARPLGFVRNRVIRIAPALWTCATIALLARLAYGEPFGYLLDAYLRTIVLFPDGPYVDGVVWTLIVEAVFYALVFLAISVGPSISLERLALVMGTASAAFITLFATATFGLAGDGLADLLDRFAFKLLLLRHGVFFAVGMLLFSMHRHGATRLKVALALGFGAFALAEIAASAGGGVAGAVQGAIWLLAVAAIIASVRYGEAVERVLEGKQRVARDLGRLSYPLYLNHYTLGMVLVPSLFALGMEPTGALVAALTITVASSWLVVVGPERMGQRWLRHYLPFPSERSQVSAPDSGAMLTARETT